ncbi:hypothetical protein [Granulicella aggregans]|uniref:hypothetical protein n=1 Tax=Granulicella aggregans TaxID=474949 RepID=UPI0021DF5D12|nr:hypothetical protein [Granulicella aggregans]
MNEPEDSSYKPLSDDDMEALRRHDRLAGQLAAWLRPFDFSPDTNTQIEMRLMAGEADGNLMRDMTTGEPIDGDRIIEAVKAGHALSLESLTHSGRFVRSVVTRETTPGEIDFNFFGHFDLIDP